MGFFAVGSDAALPGKLARTGTLSLRNRAEGAYRQIVPWIDWKALWPVSCSAGLGSGLLVFFIRLESLNLNT